MAGAKLIEDKKLGDLILLDDGLQHRALARNVEIVAIDVSSPRAVEEFTAGKLLPLGMLREEREHALRRAHIVVLNHRAPKIEGSKSVDSILSLLPREVSVFQSFVRISSVSERGTGEALPPGGEIVALCALGNPEGFFSTVKTLGTPVTQCIAKGDHKAFSAEELLTIQSKNSKAALVCSEKDAVKLPKDLKTKIYVLSIDLVIDDAGAFIEKIISRVRAQL